jgi:hypothetical protein
MQAYQVKIWQAEAQQTDSKIVMIVLGKEEEIE